MTLLLIETATGALERTDVDALVGRIAPAVAAAGAEVVESRVTADLKRLFTVVEHVTTDETDTSAAAGAPGAGTAVDALRAALAAAGVEVDDLAPVRLVGADLDEVRAAASDGPRYLVEWDLPSHLTMDAYLARKKAASPLYDQVPEVAFRRTYVREDLDKCLCFYDAPCEDDVYRAREAVAAPVDRFHELA